MGAATATATCTGGADTTTAGPGAAATTSIAITDRNSLDSLIVSHCPAICELRRQERVAPTRRGRFSLPNADGGEYRWVSAEPHLDRDPDQVRMILGAELLLEQRSGVCHRLVGNLQRIGDFDDLVAAAKQPQDFQLARRHLRGRIGLDRSARKGHRLRQLR